MRAVVIGGGTGSFTVLRGLKDKIENVSAIVSMFDSGGSTGVLRDELGILPPGDARRCLIALSPEGDILRELFMYRFDKSSLKGHSFGNLFLAALTGITGSDAEAIKQASKILHIKGNVIPVTTDNSTLCAELENTSIIRGEANIDVPKHDASLHIKRLFLDPPARANDEALSAIANADIIVIGPGDLYTSVIPNLLVLGIADALRKTKAKKAYVCNLMTKPGETHGFSAADHIREIIHYAGAIDTAIVNTALGNSALLEKYAAKNQHPVVPDIEKLQQFKIKIIAADVMSAPELIRHDSEKLAHLILSLAQQQENRDH